jgi:hypothetical protein
MLKEVVLPKKDTNSNSNSTASEVKIDPKTKPSDHSGKETKEKEIPQTKKK